MNQLNCSMGLVSYYEHAPFGPLTLVFVFLRFHLPVPA